MEGWNVGKKRQYVLEILRFLSQSDSLRGRRDLFYTSLFFQRNACLTYPSVPARADSRGQALGTIFQDDCVLS